MLLFYRVLTITTTKSSSQQKAFRMFELNNFSYHYVSLESEIFRTVPLFRFSHEQKLRWNFPMSCDSPWLFVILCGNNHNTIPQNIFETRSELQFMHLCLYLVQKGPTNNMVRGIWFETMVNY